MPFRDFSSEIREGIAGRCDFGPDEIPAIACVLNLDRWTVLTTDRLFWLTAEGFNTVDVSDLRHVDIRRYHTCLETEAQPTVTRLEFSTASGRAGAIELEPEGGFAFANVLFRIIVANHNK